MRRLAILVLVASAWAQVSIGNGTTGSVTTTGSTGAINIVSPICGPPNYCSYAGVDIVQWPIPIPNIGGLLKNNAIVYDTSYLSHGQPTGVLGRISRCTDAQFAPGFTNSTFTASEGGSGAGILWNTTSTLLRVNVSGTSAMTLFNPTTMVCGDPTVGATFGKAITKNKNLTNPGSATATSTFGTGGFSLTDPTLYYQFDTNSDVPSNTNMQVIPFTFNLSNGQYTVGSPLVDFSFALPNTSNISAWQSNTPYAYGTYVYHPLTSSEYLAWNGSTSSYVLGDLIKPGPTKNPTGCAFKLSQTGTTSAPASEPSWGSSCNGNTITDGTAKWRGINSVPTFIYQDITPGTNTSFTCPGTCPVWVPTPGHPDFNANVTDNGITWKNVGPNFITPSNIAWNDWGGTSRDGTKFSEAFSTETYGYSGQYAGYNAGAGSGIWALEYDQSTNIYHLLNTLTGIQTDVLCSLGVPGGYNCSGGTWSLVAAGQASALSNCGTVIHNIKTGNDGVYSVIARQGNPLRGSCATDKVVWKPLQTFNSTTQVKYFFASLSHWSPGKRYLWNIGNAVYGGNSGVYGVAYDMENPGTKPPAYWQASPCSTTLSGGFYIPAACDISKVIDNHLSAAYNPGDTDNNPVCGSVTNAGNSSTISTSAWENEEVCMSTTPTWLDPLSPSAGQRQWRFAHHFNTNTNALFDSQFAVSEMTQDGRFLAFTSDWNSMLGSTSGNLPTLPIANPNVVCLGGLQWTASTSYTAGTLIHPVGGTTGSGTVYHVFQAVVGGTSGTSTPSWAGSTLGNQILDPPAGPLKWQDVGPGDCRPDVMIVELK